MSQVLIFASIALGIAAMRGRRFAYAAFVVVGLLYFPARVGFYLSPRDCQVALDVPLALHWLTNYPHIILFTIFFVMSTRQFRATTRSTCLLAGLMALVMGALIEAAEGITGTGNCRLRDLIPDSAGAVIGAVSVYCWARIRTVVLSRDERTVSGHA
jgi:hypothetical protein